MFPTSDRFNFHKKNQSFKIICNYKTEHRRCHVARRTIQEPSYPREIYSYANDRFSQRKFEIDPFSSPLSESLQFEHTHTRRTKCNHCTPLRTQKKKNTHTGHTTYTTKFDIVSLSTESSIHLSSFLAALHYQANISLFLN